MELHRSLLFVPAQRREMVEKAATLLADVIVLDLEESVPPEEKQAARETARELIPGLAAAGQTVHARVNPIASGLTRDDLAAVVGPHLKGVTLAKANTPQDIRDFDVLAREQELAHDVRPGTIALIALIESAAAVLNCREISRASTRIAALAFGAYDYTYDLGVPRSREGSELAFARGVIINCAVAAGLPALDTPFAFLQDTEGLVQETELAKSLGFRGKYLVHPSQIEPVNRVFTPTDDELAQARRLTAALDEARAQGRAAVQVDGLMVDEPVAARGRRLLELARAIEAREKAFAGRRD